MDILLDLYFFSFWIWIGTSIFEGSCKGLVVSIYILSPCNNLLHFYSTVRQDKSGQGMDECSSALLLFMLHWSYKILLDKICLSVCLFVCLFDWLIVCFCSIFSLLIVYSCSFNFLGWYVCCLLVCLSLCLIDELLFVCACVSVCVYVWERKRVFICEREKECVCVFVCVRERERERVSYCCSLSLSLTNIYVCVSLCVCVCVCVCVTKRMLESVCWTIHLFYYCPAPPSFLHCTIHTDAFIEAT